MRGLSPRPTAHRTIDLTTELKEPGLAAAQALKTVFVSANCCVGGAQAVAMSGSPTATPATIMLLHNYSGRALVVNRFAARPKLQTKKSCSELIQLGVTARYLRAKHFLCSAPGKTPGRRVLPAPVFAKSPSNTASAAKTYLRRPKVHFTAVEPVNQHDMRQLAAPSHSRQSFPAEIKRAAYGS